MSTESLNYVLNLKGISDADFRLLVVLCQHCCHGDIMATSEGLLKSLEWTDEAYLVNRMDQVAKAGLIGPVFYGPINHPLHGRTRGFHGSFRPIDGRRVLG